MTIRTTDVIAPVLSTTEVVALFFARVARQTSLGCFLRRFILERNDLGRIAFGNVVLAGTVTGFATGHFVFPTANLGKLSVRGMGIGFELIFVTVFAGVAADVIVRIVIDRLRLNGVRRLVRALRRLRRTF